MIDPKIKKSITAALDAFSAHSSFDAIALVNDFNTVFAAENDFMGKVAALDAVFDNNPQLEILREVFFDLLMVNFF